MCEVILLFNYDNFNEEIDCKFTVKELLVIKECIKSFQANGQLVGVYGVNDKQVLEKIINILD